MKPSEVHSEESLPAVDLVINCFERTYRKVLAPGFFEQIVNDNQFRFSRRVVLLNNVNDPAYARSLARERQETGEIDDVFFVKDVLDEALRRTGLTRNELGRIKHYSDWALAAMVLPGSDYLVHWDADLRMASPYDWISPSLRLMQLDPRVAVANPMWSKGSIESEAREKAGDFVLSFGFSDQVYLVRRDEFARPIYHHWTPISLRYPLAHIFPYFEQMVDSYLRVSKRYRATLMSAVYVHTTKEGASYPTSFRDRVTSSGGRIFVKCLTCLPGNHRYFHQ